MMKQGQQIFRYDTFGDEIYWSDKLKLHQAIEGSKFVEIAVKRGLQGGRLT